MVSIYRRHTHSKIADLYGVELYSEKLDPNEKDFLTRNLRIEKLSGTVDEKILDVFPVLKELRIIECVIDINEKSAAVFSGLKKLRLDNCEIVNLKIPECGLQRLEFNVVRFKDYQPDMFHCLKQLNRLKIIGSNIQLTSDMLVSQSRLKKLELKLCGSDKVPSSIFRNLHDIIEIVVIGFSCPVLSAELFASMSKATCIWFLCSVKFIEHDSFINNVELFGLILNNNCFREMPPNLFDHLPRLVLNMDKIVLEDWEGRMYPILNDNNCMEVYNKYQNRQKKLLEMKSKCMKSARN